MTEKEKMLAGLPYLPSDPELFNERQHAKSRCHAFNHSDPTQAKQRMALLSDLLNLGENAYLEPHFFCDYGYNISTGKQFYANHHLTILDCCPVSIGDNVMIAPHVLISTATHPIEALERRTTEYARPITIGNDVWIGGNATILPDVQIGDNVVIGAGSVVTRDIPSNCVAVGNPCRVMKSLDCIPLHAVR